ncbi:MAG: HAD family phosphatase [Clostridia bacterium]|nr:HAD family phosphatase [Clostridia bacterium]
MLKEILSEKKLFIFDIDGTITDTEPLHRQSYDRTLRTLCPGQTMEHEEFLKNYVGSSETVIYKRMKELRGIDFDDELFFKTRIEKLFEIVREKGLETAPFYKQLERLFPHRKFIALTSQRTSVLDRFRELVDYGKIEEFISVADKPYGKKEVLADTVKYLGYKQEECVIFEDYSKTLRAAMENRVYAVGVRHTLNALTDDDCDALIDIDKEI